MNEYWDVYQMPKKLGHDWAWVACGVMSDGYATREKALEAALTHACKTVEEFVITAK